MKEYGFYIEGEWIEATEREYIDTVNPTTGEVLARFPDGNRKDAVRAIEAAERALPGWRDVPAPERGAILLEAARMMRQRKKELGKLVTEEMGKIISEGEADVQESIDFLEYIAGEGRRLFGRTTTSELRNKFCMTVLQPVGVVGLITPWNFPTAIPCWKIGAALVSGNTAVFKPASGTPLCAARLVEIFGEAGLPSGVLNMVTGPGSVVGKEIVENSRVKVVSFTGGVSAGLEVLIGASRQLKRAHLELGGKNPQVIMDDADLDLAVEGAVFGAFGSAGQRCTATSRLIIHEDVYDAFLEKLLGRTRNLRTEDPLDPDTDMGPVADASQERKVLEYIDIGREEGAKLLLGGEKMAGKSYDRGFFIQPTIFEARHGMRITREEIFGPVLSVMKAASYEEAVKMANDVDYGLSSSIYTRDVGLAFRAMRDFETGITYVNAPTIGAEVHLPFGGIKNTGNGSREAGWSAIEEFTEIKTIFLDYSDRLQKAQMDKEGHER